MSTPPPPTPPSRSMPGIQPPRDDYSSGGVDVATAVLLASVAAIEMMGIRINDQADDIQKRIDEVKHLRELKNMFETMTEVEMEENDLVESVATKDGTITQINDDGTEVEYQTQVIEIELKNGYTIAIEKAAQDGVQYSTLNKNFHTSLYTHNTGDILAVAIFEPNEGMPESKSLTEGAGTASRINSLETTNSLLGLTPGEDGVEYYQLMDHGEAKNTGLNTGVYALELGEYDVYLNWDQDSNDLELHIKSPSSMFGISLMIDEGDFTADYEVEMHTELGFEGALKFAGGDVPRELDFEEITDSAYNTAAKEIISLMNELSDELGLDIKFEDMDLESAISFLNNEFDAEINVDEGQSFVEGIQEFTTAVVEEISDRITDLLGENQIEMLYLQKDLSTMVFYIQLASNIMNTYYKDGLSTIARNM